MAYAKNRLKDSAFHTKTLSGIIKNFKQNQANGLN